MERVLKKFGWVKMKQPRKWDNTKYTVDEIGEIVTAAEMFAGILVTVANHHTCVRDGKLIDIWDCSHKSIGNYYVKSNACLSDYR